MSLPKDLQAFHDQAVTLTHESHKAFQNYTNSFAKPYGTVYLGMGHLSLIAQRLKPSSDGKDFFATHIEGSNDYERVDRHKEYQALTEENVTFQTLEDCLQSTMKKGLVEVSNQTTTSTGAVIQSTVNHRQVD